MQNAEKIVTSNAENKATVYLIFTSAYPEGGGTGGLPPPPPPLEKVGPPSKMLDPL